MKKIIAYLTISILLCSCEFEKEIDYRTIYDGDKLIVHGFISPQDGIRVIVKKTVPPNDMNGNDKVSNATVSVFEGDKQIAVLKSENNYLFVSDESFVPELGKKYFVRVKSDGMAEIRSSAQLLIPETPIDSFRIVPDPFSNFMQMIVFFTNKNPLNYAYYFKMISYQDTDDNENPVWESIEFFNPYGTIENIVSNFNATENPIYNTCDSIQVELFVLSPDLSLFLESQRKFESSKDDPFFDRPYPVFSNIDGGFGIFGAYSVYRKMVYRHRVVPFSNFAEIVNNHKFLISNK